MWRRSVLISSVLLLTLGLSISCRNGEQSSEPTFEDNGTIVCENDSEEWRVKLFKEHLLYAAAVETNLPAPWSIPTREEAQVLHLLSFPSEERFITSDGYTFGMPSSSVSKAGQKTKYSVLGLWRRRTTIEVTF